MLPSPLTTADAVAQSDVDLAGQLLIDQPQGQRAELQQVDNEAADHENVADEEVAQELGLQQLQEAHFSRKTFNSVNGFDHEPRPRHSSDSTPRLSALINGAAIVWWRPPADKKALCDCSHVMCLNGAI